MGYIGVLGIKYFYQPINLIQDERRVKGVKLTVRFVESTICR
jgi:hypothetical protein